MKRIFTAVVVVVGLAFCSVAVAAAGLSGTYKRTVHSTVLGGQLNGKWTVNFKNGTYKVADGGHAVVHGNYTIKGSKISLKDTGGEGKCPGTGVYKFKVSGASLTFTKVSDPSAACIGRRTVLVGGAFKKS